MKKTLLTLFLLGYLLCFLPPVVTAAAEESALTAGSVDELLQLFADPDRTEKTINITADLTIEDYVDLQQTTKSVFLNLGQHSLTVKSGGWLVLFADRVYGAGTDQPLIRVENGGSLVLGSVTNYALGLGRMNLFAEGLSEAGGTAVEIQEGGYFSAANHPLISAYGAGARAVSHPSAKAFSLPSGLTLYAQGEGAAALECGGDVDVFYASVRADGSGADAIRVPAGAAITADSAEVAPAPASMINATSTFVEFNEAVMQINLWKGSSAGLYLSDPPRLATVARGGNMAQLEAIWVKCKWNTGGADFTQTGTYNVTGSFSPLFPVTINGLPLDNDVTVKVMDSKEKPDISTIYPLMPTSIGGSPISYGFYIVSNAAYTRDMATLWCSVDDGKSWVEADTLLQVFMQQTFWALNDPNIYVTGLEPGKNYLFRLESSGRDTMNGEYAMAGVSDIRQVSFTPTGQVSNIDWSGDRDGGDTDGNPPTDTIQPAPAPAAPETGTEGISNNDKSNNSAGPSDQTPPAAEKAAAASPLQNDDAKQNTAVEKFSETYSLITGLRLRMMIEDNKAAVFSKQGVTITIPEQTIRALNIADDDMFKIQIERQNNRAFSFSILINNIAVKKLDQTMIQLPYRPAGKATWLTLATKQGEYITNGSFDDDQKIASFEVKEPGQFIIQEKNKSGTTTTAPAELPSNSRSMLPIALSAATVLLVAAISMIFLYKRRKRR